MAAQVPGTTCQFGSARTVDGGTACLAASPRPGSIGQRPGDTDVRALEEALKALQAEAETFAWRYLTDARARRTYVSRIAAKSRELLDDVRAGRLTAGDGAAIANAQRNVIREEVRAISSAIGRAKAVATEVRGPTLEEALEKAVNKLFKGKTFAELSTVQKRQVFEEVIEASGRSSPRFTSQIPKWTNYSRAFAVVTVAISIYNIWEAENKLRQGVKEGSTLLGGALGGAAADASAGFLCGPGAPACVTVLFIIGGIAGALVASKAADLLLDQRVVVEWLGD